MAEMWTEKYFPKGETEFIGNSEIVSQAIEWAKHWDKGETLPPLLLWGQAGSGKTCLAYLLAKKFGWNMVELNNSDLRSKSVIEKVIGAASSNASFFGAKRLILLDEVDCLTRTDRGGASAIGAIIKSAKNPIVLTANDIFSNKSVSSLRFVCKSLEFKKINYLSMANRLKEILAQEGTDFDEESVKELARNSAGDMRSALLDLETLSLSGPITPEAVASLSSRERQQKVFSVMKAIFKGTDFSEVRSARSKSDLRHDLLFRWVEENIPRQYSEAGDVALAFDRLSRADIFDGRIYRRQHWGFLRYSSALACEGVAFAKEKPSYDFAMYQFPGLLSMLSRTSSERALKKSIGSKIGSLTHSSSRKVISKDLPFLRDVFLRREKAVALTAIFGLDDKELAFILGTKPDTKKVKSIIEEAKELEERNAKPRRIFGDAVRAEEIEIEEPEQEDEEAPDIPSPHEDSTKQTRLF